MNQSVTHRIRLATAFACVLACAAVMMAVADGGVPKQNGEILDNGTVIELQKLGLGDGVIVEKIKTSKCRFDTSLDGLKQLKGAGLSDAVITAMMAATSKGKVGLAAATEVSGDVNDPKSPHEPGIWLYVEGAKSRMTKLEASVYSQIKQGRALFPQFGQTAKNKGVLRSPHAVIQSANPRPTFYFYFDNSSRQTGPDMFYGSSPNEFVLASFDVNEKANIRTLVIAQANNYSGEQIGPEDKALRPFQFEKVGPGVYKVIPRDTLGIGEYGFSYASKGSGMGHIMDGKVFDFGAPGSVPAADASK
jgi:hypothetical protein